jgi:UDP-glucuronate 4-epimerase|tara:strand:+ start:3101 stop:3268 length:168 start_codon:yes stop_codon:yes gene_type:complete
MKILVTGVARFIKFNLSKFLLEKKFKVIGLGNINDYYSTQLRKDHLNQVKKFNNF